MVPSLPKLGALATLFHLSSIYVASGQSCGCSSLVIPVHVDVLIPKDPADPFGGLKAMQAVYAVWKKPNIGRLRRGIPKLSYTEFACDRGLSSLAIDLVGVGLSSRPANASDVQFATNAAVVSQLARHLKIASIIAGVQPFKKVIAIGHSAGSATLTFGATAERAHSPFDGFILTGNVNFVHPSTLPGLPGLMRHGTIPRSGGPILPRKPQLLLARMAIFDAFTKDVGPLSAQSQGGVTSLPAHYPGPVAKVVGSEDQGFCTASNCVDVVALNASERLLWPDARSFDVVVAQGSGHDLNLDFFAKGPFNTFVEFVEKFAEL
ncbi:hypothetical protein B0H13DRAFT_2267599 [Mycena leptocephala]|nr:hypothetical protein B0H13DRAFT_2267599 [Mycena leptocephala]